MDGAEKKKCVLDPFESMGALSHSCVGSTSVLPDICARVKRKHLAPFINDKL